MGVAAGGVIARHVVGKILFAVTDCSAQNLRRVPPVAERGDGGISSIASGGEFHHLPGIALLPPFRRGAQIDARNQLRFRILFQNDAADPVCYTFEDEDSKVGIATDFGTYDDYLVEKMQGCESLLVEANHDLNMLMVGPYPYPLKRRIMGNTGHLSNERAGQFLSRVIGKNCRNVFLGHLSKENNYGELAYETVRVELLAHNIDMDKANFTMRVADRYAPTFVL